MLHLGKAATSLADELYVGEAVQRHFARMVRLYESAGVDQYFMMAKKFWRRGEGV
jgi:hypothetical protein